MKKWKCGYLGVPLATNVASEEILLDTAELESCELKKIYLVVELLHGF